MSSSDCVHSGPTRWTVPLRNRKNSSGSTHISMEARWGVNDAYLRQLVQLHDASLPITYDVGYYKWLKESALVLVAYTTRKGMEDACCTTAGEESNNSSMASSSSTSSNSSGSGSGTVSPAWKRKAFNGKPPRGLTAELADDSNEGDSEDTAIRAEVEQFVSETEYRCLKQDMEKKKKKRQAARGDEVTAAEADEDHCVVVGIVTGFLAYGRHVVGSALLTNPTGYLANFAIDPALRGLGIGDGLLRLFTTYMTKEVPLRASSYLHYDAQRMFDLIIEQDCKKAREKAAAKRLAAAKEKEKVEGAAAHEEQQTTPLLSSKPPPPSSSWLTTFVSTDTFLSSLLRVLLPEMCTWLESREERASLLADGVDADEVDAIIVRRRAAAAGFMDDLTEEQQERANPIMQRGVREIWLHCLAGDSVIIDFYKKRGFREVRTLENFYEILTVKYDAALLVYAAESSSSDVSTVAAASVAAQKPNKGAPPPLPVWLTHDELDNIEDISMATVEKCRREWRAQAGGGDGGGSSIQDGDGSWKEMLISAFLTANALIALGTVCCCVYYYGAQ